MDTLLREPVDVLAWASDPVLRRNSSSGGFVRAMLTYLLQTGQIDAALVARTGAEDDPFQPGFTVVDDPEELRSRRYCSVYHPTDPFETVLQPGLRYAITLLPCQVERLRCLQQSGCWPQVRYVFSLLCAGMPRLEWTQSLFKKQGASTPTDVGYRGNGWPGTMVTSGIESPIPTWTDDDVIPRCLRCRRTTAESDWTCADPWGCKQKWVGLGRTLVRIYTKKALHTTGLASLFGLIHAESDGGLMGRRLFKHARRRR